MNKQKFDSAIENYFNGNLKDFRKFLKSLSKSDLLKFISHCYIWGFDNALDIFEIEKQFSLA